MKLPDTHKNIKKRNQLKEIWRRLKKNKPAVIGFIVFSLLCLVAIFGELIVPYSAATDQNMLERLQPPSAEHIFGTDAYGRDQYARVIHSAKISLSIGVLTALGAMAVGTIIGACSAFYSKGVDNILMRFIDILASIPPLLLALVIVATLGASLRNLIIAIGVSNIPSFARLSRSTMLTIMEQLYIEAARAYGTSDIMVMFKHVLPNAFGPIIVQTTMSIADMILAAASLSYLGLGIQPPTPEWGGMLNAGREYLQTSPYLLVYPGLAIVLASLSVSLFGDGLRDTLDPRLKT
jgi:peptide/nickel transport system permease protein